MSEKLIANSHARILEEFTHGKGVYLFSGEHKYLDFMAGIAVNSLGHANPKMVKAIINQSKKLWHISNIFYTETMKECAQTVCDASGMKKVFFTNSGSEAMEAAIKVIRKYFHDRGYNDKYEIITMKGSFHGRSITNISASQEPAYTKGFEPLLQGFKQVAFGDIDALKNAVTEKTAGILLEPIQGEGGLNFAGWQYIAQVSQIAKDSGILLALDEVQCGASRTGKFNAFHWAGIKPDIVSMAKGIGGGFPVGMTLFAETTADVITVGSHGTTFGGNSLAMAVTNTVCKELTKPKFLENINKQAKYLKKSLTELQKQFPSFIKDIRGFGLMTGFMLNDHLKAKEFSQDLFDNKLITIAARENVIRLLPPLILKKQHIDEAINIIEHTMKKSKLS